MLPQDFEKRMKRLLGDAEYALFLESFGRPDVRGVRINSLKCDPRGFAESTDIPLTPLPYADDGFILGSDMAVGASAEHHAGIMYMQDPGAMAPVCALDIPKGARVLDMCAAPGGKSGQAAARIREDGFLLSNEFVPKRAKITVGNFERLGIKNAVVTSLDTAALPKLYRAFFDVVIADVPCSGEGMFRKNPLATEEWSEAAVAACAERGRAILENTASLVAEGGHIIYSTCTYSTEENEDAVRAFLEAHPDYELAPVKEELARCTRDGANQYGEEWKCLSLCRRFYPHVSEGEGQFLALLHRKECADKPAALYKGQEKPLEGAEREIARKFLSDALTHSPDARCVKVGENIVLISHGVPIPPCSVFSAGVLLGEIRKGTLIPAHQFFSAYGADFRRRVELSDTPDRLRRYLRGEEIEYEGDESGWCAVTYLGAPIGGGKISSGRVKNHYPKGLRNN